MGNTNKPVAGGTYKCDAGISHFVHFISKHDTTGEAVVVYEALNGPSKIQHCSIDQFMQQGRFTLFKHPKHIPMD